MKRIYKYAIAPPDRSGGYSVVNMPAGARVLSVSNQGDTIQCWAAVDPAKPIVVPKRFLLFGTGWDLDLDDTRFEALVFHGTVLLEDGALVFHVFEELAR